MPTKEELEATNDALLGENERLKREQAALVPQLTRLNERLWEIAAKLEKTSPNHQPEAAGADQIAAQVEARIATQFAPVISRMGEVIATMERAA